MRWASKGKDIHAISYHDTIKLTKRSSPLSRKNGLKGEAHFVKIISPLRLALSLIEQKLDFVQLDFPSPDALPGYFDKVNLSF